MELDYFKQYLRNYMRDHGFDTPDLTSDIVDINADNANNTFETARRSGSSVDEAIELGLQDLFVGIGDSYRETLSDILLDHFKTRVNVDDVDFLEYWIGRFSEQYAMFMDLKMERGIGLDPKALDEKKEVLIQRMDKYLTIHGL